MAWSGFENFGQNFAPLADAQLKQAYNDYQAQKDLNMGQRQLQQDKMAAQEAAKRTGYDSPLVDKVALNPQAAKALGYTEPKEGEDSDAHMKDFYALLGKQYPGSVDEQTGKVHPSLAGDAQAIIKAQKSLEQKASELALKRAADKEKMDQQFKNNVALENIRSGNIAGRSSANGKMTPQQKQVMDEIGVLNRAKYNPMTDLSSRVDIDQQIEDLKMQLNAAAPKAAKPSAPSNGYQAWLQKHSAQDTEANKAFYLKATGK